MGDSMPATIEGPARRRDSWSIKTLVEDVSGRSITEFQEPGQPVHPYLKVKFGPTGTDSHPPGSRPAPPLPRSATAATGEEPSRSMEATESFDPVARVYPPLAGATARQLHGAAEEHHHETLHRMAADREPLQPGDRPHSPGPSQRPERIYLHYLLLHIDRLSDGALRYLQTAVNEELTHREPPPH
jgi:hypothetical protein